MTFLPGHLREACEILSAPTRILSLNEEADVPGKPLICPFCGAPYDVLIPADASQAKCRYCGAVVLVPPRLGGKIQTCPNHPDAQALGLCNECCNSFCDRCLYVVPVRDGTLYLCPGCYETRDDQKFGGAMLCILASIPVFLFYLALRSDPRFGVLGQAAVLLFAFGLIALGVLGLHFYFHPRLPPTVHDKRKEFGIID